MIKTTKFMFMVCYFYLMNKIKYFFFKLLPNQPLIIKNFQVFIIISMN